ncbi:MAG: DUF3488 and transglutaminase-like domain-containing protein [bacterium]|nr:DUF3488 and transglutaminase-like domain-containing protein [bacterium]
MLSRRRGKDDAGVHTVLRGGFSGADTESALLWNRHNPWTKPGRRGPLLAAVVLACLLHLVNISVPTLLLCLGMWGYHFAGFFRPLPRPGAKLITVAGALLFLAAAGTNEGLTVEAFVSLLVLMIALKLFELRHQHDATMTVILNYFVIVSGMFFSDSLLVTGYIAFALLYNTAVLVHVRQPGMALGRSFRLAGRLSLQALPFMLIFFIFFPRFQGGLWGRPTLMQERVGISDTIRMGSIASLAENTEVAFRVSFAGAVPPVGELYWRGLILWDFDGLSWTRGERRGLVPERTVRSSAPPVDYIITLEAHQQRWLYSLDRPVRMQQMRGTWMGNEGEILTWRPVTSRLQYSGTSDPRAERQQLQQGRLAQMGLQLPDAGTGNKRARELALSWQQGNPESRAVVNEAFNFFSRGGFRYTLSPGTPTAAGVGAENAIDHFLFTGKAGFCEHYATSFAFLMRAAGVPTRLVGGYLGGSLNPYGNYLIVRQSDAHVWCEVLLDGEWQRIDPTAAVAPERLQTNSLSRLGMDEGLTLDALFNLGRLPAWLQPLANGWDLLNMRWNQWVMQYSFAEQSRLFSRLGLDSSRGAAMLSLLIAGIALIGIVYFFLLVFLKPGVQERDKVALFWQRFLKKLDKAQIHYSSSQGPVQFLQHISSLRPDMADAAAAVVRPYVRLRYSKLGEEERSELEGQLKEAVRRFSVQALPKEQKKKPA